MSDAIVIDGLQYINWNRQRFEKTRDAGIHCVHITVSYWETFRETVANISAWNQLFRQHQDLICFKIARLWMMIWVCCRYSMI